MLLGPSLLSDDPGKIKSDKDAENSLTYSEPFANFIQVKQECSINVSLFSVVEGVPSRTQVASGK